MISDMRYREAYVWVWLPGEVQPVVAGRLAKDGNTLVFNYGKSYLERANSVPLYEPELPLQSGLLPLLQGMSMPSCLRDAAPDAWGRRVLMFKRAGGARNEDLDELSCLLESGSNRIGALDFQFSPTAYQPRLSEPVTLEELQESTERIVNGQPLSPELAAALQHGTSIGGARPKANIETADKQYVAKFSLSTDLYNIIKAEFVAMRLAHLAGLNVAPVELKTALNKDVLLVERFDRVASEAGWQRKMMVSALTLLELDEMFARYASYEDLAEIIRHRFLRPDETLRELFGRIVFNILCGNTDDHARNHAAFWDGSHLALTPAYDLCPQSRAGNEASQAMKIHGDNNMAQLKVCLASAPGFMLSAGQAQEIIDHQITQIETNWEAVCDEAGLTRMERQGLWGRQFMNPYSFE
ncbi:MAG: HipA domain-containing protein [Gallionella sp.]|jgi:serine/threonine-protein kinase HipA|nr:type II toxin-antitoxin system HipA family toxin [Gallionella sp.]MCK9354477.1 type II toxin-antitoxin system HipA family toxin [Gallionella sp.]